jgi:catechol 2,3-dioxygenase-like lactoylglutathione lyase family enzyme
MKIRHVGLVVKNLGESILFYESIGFRVFSNEIEQGNHISNFFSEEGLQVHIAKLKNDFGECLELLWFGNGTKKKKNSLKSLGLTHIALTVRDSGDLYSSFKKCCEVQTTPTGHKVLFVQDPNGVFLELVQDPRC